MIEDGENPTPTPMDSSIDGAIIPQMANPEKYNNKTDSGVAIADGRQPAVAPEPIKAASATIAEIERSLAKGVLKSRSKRFDQFALDMNRKNDIRLKGLSKVVGPNLTREHKAEMTTGPEGNRVRKFDIQSQTLRSIQANAALGSYQFQKGMVLPYMRKSLALSYHKASLMKQVVKGISSLQLALVEKLEAIKINTAAVIPRKKSFLAALREDVSNLNRMRIAGNISNALMESNSKLYQKYVAPTVRRVSDTLNDDSKNAGVNGVRRFATGKLNSLRLKTRNIADPEVAPTGLLGKLKVTGAKAASGILGSTISLSHNLKLGEKTNRMASKLLGGQIEPFARFDPFAPFPRPGEPVEHDGSKSTLALWKQEYRKDLDAVIYYLSEISDNTRAGPKKPNRGPRPGGPTRRPNLSRRTPIENFSRYPTETPDAPSPTEEIEDIIQQPDAPRKMEAYGPPKPKKSIGSILKKSRVKTQQNKTKILTAIGRGISPIVKMAPRLAGKLALPMAATAALAPQAVKAQAIKDGVSTAIATIPDRTFFAEMFTSLGQQVATVSSAVTAGNKQRSLFEKLQTKWHTLREKMRSKGIRKNSYEDLEAHRDKNKPLAWKSPTDIKRGELDPLKVLDPTGGYLSDLLGWGEDSISDWVGDKKSSRPKRSGGRLKSLGSKLKRGVRSGGKGIKGRIARLFARGATEVGENAVANVAKKSLLKRSAGMLWKGTAGASKLAGKGLWGATKLTAKAGWGATKLTGKLGWGATKLGGKGLLGAGKFLGKGFGPALAVGIGTSLADDWLDSHTTGTTKRLGKTATSALSWGATGATLGSFIPIVGTAVGGAIGATLGALSENTDIISYGLKSGAHAAYSGLSTLGKMTVAGGGSLMVGLTGKLASMGADKLKHVTGDTSVLGSIKSLFFGKEAKYDKDGKLQQPGMTGFFPQIKKTFTQALFGTPGQPNTGIIPSIRNYASAAVDKAKAVGGSAVSAVGNYAKAEYEGAKKTAGVISSTASNVAGNISQGLKGAMQGALAMVGMSETSDRSAIQGYLAKGGAGNGVDPSTTAWCAAFVNATLAQAGLKGTGKLTASSFLSWGNAVEPKMVQAGDVLIEDRGAAAGQSGSHVGMATGNTRMKDGKLQIEMLSGNSGNRVTRIFYDASKLKIRRSNDSAANKALKMTVKNNPWDTQLKNQPGASQNPNESTGLWDKVKSGAQAVGSATSSLASSIFGKESLIGRIGSSIGDAVGEAYDAAKNVVYKMSGSTKENFKKIIDIATKFGDPHPEITAAQWALESAWGQKMSGKNNPFGQKARKGEPATMVSTREVLNGRDVRIMAPFKDYDSIEQAVQEHVERWTKRKTQPGTTPIQAASAIKAAGYATDPNYVTALGKILASNNIDPNKPFTGFGGSKPATASGVSPMKPTQAASSSKPNIQSAFNASSGKAPSLLSKPSASGTPTSTAGLSYLAPGKSAKDVPAFVRTPQKAQQAAKPTIKTTPAPQPAKADKLIASPTTAQQQTTYTAPSKPAAAAIPAPIPVVTEAPVVRTSSGGSTKSDSDLVSTNKSLISAMVDLTAAIIGASGHIAKSTAVAETSQKQDATSQKTAASTSTGQAPAPIIVPINATPTRSSTVMIPMSMAKTDPRTGLSV